LAEELALSPADLGVVAAIGTVAELVDDALSRLAPAETSARRGGDGDLVSAQ
jgi:hypothetical protein